MLNFLKKKWVKYMVVLVIIAGLAVGGYYIYSYYENQFVNPYLILVRFKRGITEQQAITVLSGYDDSALPLHYDLPNYAAFENVTSSQTFEFTVKGYRNWKSTTARLNMESSVEFAS